MPSRRDALGLCGGALLGVGLAGYVGPEGGRTRTPRTDDGTELWRATIPGDYPPTPAAGPDGAYVATTAGGVGKIGL
ncbi:hypothetical protein [Halobaculum gomorrense]|uniref:Uncharacterized protein n=1 Tax=Halobaculum gomorrense TaxID=43928 RepID=A0A1M5RDE4_9EURY|nr:hypothetical protein [Halobaculum gomorrense]SHH24218.1 hypothetical protein SAMN05443636_2149 [Halobaculum gomorrense]